MGANDLIKGHLDPLVMAIVEREPMHGYQVMEELRRRSRGDFDLPEGSVYPALYRLERAGLLKSTWAVEAGRRRRVYALTRKGRGALEVRRKEWQGFSSSINAVLGDGRA